MMLSIALIVGLAGMLTLYLGWEQICRNVGDRTLGVIDVVGGAVMLYMAERIVMGGL